MSSGFGVDTSMIAEEDEDEEVPSTPPFDVLRANARSAVEELNFANFEQGLNRKAANGQS